MGNREWGIGGSGAAVSIFYVEVRNRNGSAAPLLRFPIPDSPFPIPIPVALALPNPSTFMSLEPLGYCLSCTAPLQSVTPVPINLAQVVFTF